MEESVEEIVETFEIVDENECKSDCVSPTSSSSCIQEDDKSNNNHISEKSMESTSDDNNNKSNMLVRKFSRDELIKVKQSMPFVNSAIKESVLLSIYQEDSTLERTLERQKGRSGGSRVGGDAIDKMMPQYTQRNSYQKQRSVDHQSTNRRSQQGNRANSSQNLIQKRLTTNEEVQLNTAENAWKPTALTKGDEFPETEAKSEELLKQFRSILNKLTPENFPTLIQNLKQLTIDTVDRLDGCISLVFEKAINEPSFSASYAQLCKEVSIVFVVPLDEKNSQQKAVFKNRLITQCQNEFMKLRDSAISKTNAERLKQIEEEVDNTRKDELKAEIEDENFKIRRRAVGTVHFIGELYKIEMLTSKIMNSCIGHLLDPSMCSEETLECLCKLLTTIGKCLEKNDDKNAKKIDLSEYFATLSKIADKKYPLSISSRIRFMIQDLIELRLNNWTPRKLQRENKPLTMDEIKRQVEMEQYTSKMDIRENDNRNRSGYGPNKSQRPGMANEDGWSTASYTKKPINFDVKKLTNLPQLTDDIVLGGQGVPSFQNFSSNRFSGLREDESMPEQSSNSNNIRSYQGRYSGGGQNMSSNQNRNSVDRNNRRNNSNNGSNQNRSAGSRSLQPMNMGQNESSSQKQGFTANRKISHQQQQARPIDLPMNPLQTRKISAPARTMSESKTENIIEDPIQVCASMKKFVNSFQCGEMKLDEVVEKLHGYRFEKEALVKVYNWSFDQNEKERFHLTEILCECVDSKVFSIEVMKVALQELIESAAELVCDLPHVFRYIGEILALPIIKRIILVSDLLEISNIEIERNNGASVLKNVLKVLEEKHEKTAAQQLYNESKGDFQKFIDKDTNLNEFLKENNFEYLVDEENHLDETTIAEIHKTLKSPSRDVDSLILWIQDHVKHTSDVGFIRSLTEVVLDICLEKTLEGYQVNKSKLENASALLTQFTDGKMDREIYCLYAINAKLVEIEHPVGCTNEILTCLYDNFVFSKVTFMKWKDDDNPKEQEGKGVTLKSCTGFIQFLRDSADSTGEEI